MFNFDKPKQEERSQRRSGKQARREICPFQEQNEFGSISGINNEIKKPVFSLPTHKGESLEEARKRLSYFKVVIEVKDGFQAFKTKEDYKVWKAELDKNNYIEVDYADARELFEDDDELLEEFDDVFGDFL